MYGSDFVKFAITDIPKLLLIMLGCLLLIMASIIFINQLEIEHDFELYSCESLLEEIQHVDYPHRHLVSEWIKKECWKV